MSTRLTYIFSFLAICGILGTSVYLQVAEGIMPCPLCTLQRITFGVIGGLLFLGILLYRKRMATILLNFFVVVFSILGFIFAARQTWLQHFPSSSGSECGVSLDYMIQALPWSEVLEKIFTGSAECTTRQWELLSMSIPEWSVIFFCILFCVGGLLFIRDLKQKAD
jgi:disulfide bond formation protein DsbB